MKRAEYLSTHIINELGEVHVSTQYLESGATSAAFRVISDRSEYILKVANPNTGKTANYESDYQIRSKLFSAGLPVSRPVATNETMPIDAQEIWAFDEYKAGTHPIRGNVPGPASEQLGSLLRYMHSLPVSRFGQLENSVDSLTGVAASPELGLLTRFESPWPFSTVPLDNHPSIRLQPALKPELQRLESELTAFVHGAVPSVIHTDLHERQLIVRNGELVALLDFNEAGAGRPEWDLGSYLYFHGGECLKDLLNGYADNSTKIPELLYHSQLASILIALHHGNRGIVVERRHRIEASVKFLEGILSE